MERVLHMNGGEGEASYIQNSLHQKKVITMTKTTRQEAIRKLYNSFPTVKCIAIADLGCSTGPNALLTVHELVTTLHEVRRELESHSPVRIQMFLNDLPGNNFDSIFKELPSFNKQLKQEIGDGFGGCFVYGTPPGSFYDRLFESQSLHFVHSSYSLHWLSQVPNGIGRSNKSESTVTSVIKAYYKQFQMDFNAYLQCRSEELVIGGCMVLTLAGRSDDPSIKGSDYVSELLLLTLSPLGGFDRRRNSPYDQLSGLLTIPNEIEIEVKKESSFEINQLQAWELEWGAAAPDNRTIDDEAKAGRVTSMMRSISESLLVEHFDQGMRDEIFRRYGQVIADYMAKERRFFTNITVSLTKNI